LIFPERYQIVEASGGKEMESNKTKEMECPVCEADIPLDGDEKSGDIILCSYCKVTFKLLRKKGDWVLAEAFEE